MKASTSFILGIATAISHFLNAQDLVFKKSVVKSIEDVKIDLPFEQRNKLLKDLSKQRGTDVSRQASGETVIHDFNGTKIAINNNSDKSELIKYVNNQVVAKREYYPHESIAIPVDDKGNVVINSMDGCVFLSPQLETVSIYEPFESGCSDSHFGYSDKLVCFYSIAQIPPKTYKLGLLDHTGKLIAEREFESNGYGASDIKIIDSQVFLLLNNYSGPESKILAFDGSLNLSWEKKFSNRISGYSFESDGNSKSLLAITQKEVSCMNIFNGNNKWELTTDEVYGKAVSSTVFSPAYVMNGQDVAIVITELNDGKFLNGKLVVLNAHTGKKKFGDELGSFNSWPKVISGSDGFIISDENQIFSYANAPSK